MSKLSDILASRARAATNTNTPQPQAAPGHTRLSLNGAKPAAQPAAPKPLQPPRNKVGSFRAPPVPQAPASPRQSAEQIDLGAVQINLNVTRDVADWSDERLASYTDAATQELRGHLNELSAKLVTHEVSDVLLRCMTFLDTNPAMREILLPEDIGLLVKALQSSAGVIITQKETKSTKKSARQEKVNELADAFASFGFMDNV